MKLGEKITRYDCLHAFENHVDITDQDMIDRLIYGDTLNGFYNGNIKNISTKFLNEKVALKAIERTIVRNTETIRDWMKRRSGTRLIITLRFLNQIGYGFAKWTDFSKCKYDLYRCIVVLKPGYNGDTFEIVSAYPDVTPPVAAQIQEDRKIFREKTVENRRTQV